MGVMAQNESNILDGALFTSCAINKALVDAVAEYHRNFGEGFALLYSPTACWLGRLETDATFSGSSKKGEPRPLRREDLSSVFEARVFNPKAELRWLNEKNGVGPAVVLSASDASDFFGSRPAEFTTKTTSEEKVPVEVIEQSYLLWGQSTGTFREGWTQFAEARIGAYFVPLKNVPRLTYAKFKAIEYLCEYEDGNVAVAEERLVGIEEA
jgi:CRISPR-associated protein (TIGR03984 family)